MVHSIAEVKHKLEAFDKFARKTGDTKALQKKWHSLFGTELTERSAKSFVVHYREMRSKHTRGSKSRRRTLKQRGGVAQLSYVMTPGADVSVYGRFPVEVDTDPGSIRDLDVYFQNALTFSCGNKNEYWPTVPANMGSNQVGGRRGRTNRNRKGRGRGRGRKARGTMRKGRRAQRGGDIFSDLGNYVNSAFINVTGSPAPSLDPISRPAFATVYPNPFQMAYSAYSGEVPGKYPASPAPEERSWDYQSKGTSMSISPQNQISNITADFNKQTSPAIYQSSAPPPTGGVTSRH